MEFGLGASHLGSLGILFVLILVLVEFGLGDNRAKMRETVTLVLILVLVEFGLGVIQRKYTLSVTSNVLILVLVEFGLGVEFVEAVRNAIEKS